MATLEELVVRIRADASQLERELAKAGNATQKAAGGMQKSLSSARSAFMSLIPAISGAALIGFTKDAIDAAGRMTDLAGRVGFAASTLSALEGGLKASGSSLEDFAASINLMNANIGQAASGNEQMVEVFKRLGLAVEDLKRMSPEDQFYAIADALAAQKTQYEQTELGRAVFGRGFASMLPMLKEGAGNLRDATAALKEMNAALTDEQIARVDELGDAFGRVALTIRNKLIGAISDATKGFTDLFGVAEDPNSGEIQSKIDRLRDALAVPERNRTRDRMGNVVQSDAAIKQEIARLEGLMEVQRRYEMLQTAKADAAKGVQYGPFLPEKGGTKGPKADDAALKKANELLAERNRIIAQNRTAYEIFIQDSMRANELFANDTEQRNRELQRAWEEYVAATADNVDASVEHIGKAKDAVDEIAVSIRSSLANSFEDAIFEANSFADSLTSILDGIARQIARAAIIDPLADSITSSIKSSGFLGSIGSFLGLSGARASGGPVGGGQSYLVGENGPEIFTPSASGFVTPNHAMGGMTQHVNITINPSVQGAMRAEIMNAIPAIVNASKNATFEAIAKGGPESRMLGKRG